jgi:glycosyltransferase involved in cell wall biosynthesis
MRIGLVLPAVPAYSETFFVNKIKGLQSHGHEVILFVNAQTQLASFEGAAVQSMTSLSKNPIKAITVIFALTFKAVQRFYRLEQKDGSSFFLMLKRILINSHLLSQKLDWLHFGFGTMALDRENTAKAIGAKMAVSFRGYDHYVYPLKNKDCYAKLFSKEARYHVLSEGMKKTLLQKGILPGQIAKITPAIDRTLFFKSEKPNANTVLQLATIARLHWIKGLECTLEALALLRQNGVSFHYTIVGDGPEKERLQFAAHQLGLSAHVAFAGKLSPDQVRATLDKSDVYLQYSFQEGFCNAVLEAQAMGKICVVSNAEGLSENVLHEVTGFVVRKRNSVSLANQLLEVIKLSEPEKACLSEKAMARVDSDFSLPKQIEEFISFYNL